MESTMESVVVGRTRKAFLTSGEVAKLIGCSSYWVNVLISRGQLDTHRIGDSGWHRVSVASLEKYASAHNFTIDWSLLVAQ